MDGITDRNYRLLVLRWLEAYSLQDIALRDGISVEEARRVVASMVTSKPANEGHLKTGQRRASETGLF
jgi:hypothetical protein